MDCAARQERLDQFRRVCREHGLAVTVQRQAVFEALLGREDHPTVDQVYAQMGKAMPGISRTTVYRILDTLAQLGLVVRICHPGSGARFDPRIRQHHHLVCARCERIIDIEDDRLNRIRWPDVRAFGFEIHGFHVHFRGTCADCRRQEKKGGGAARPVNRHGAKEPACHPQPSNPRRRIKT